MKTKYIVCFGDNILGMFSSKEQASNCLIKIKKETKHKIGNNGLHLHKVRLSLEENVVINNLLKRKK